MRWYADAHHVATVIANGDAHLCAGMLAIYSPQQGWISNVLTPLACSVNARESVDPVPGCSPRPAKKQS
jgi:hypothetical protein